MVKETKPTEIGDIPIDWEIQTFEETFRVLSNNTLSRDNLNDRGGAVRNIHYGDILTKFSEILNCDEDEIPYINDLSLITASAQLLQDGDIVIADTAEDETVGKTTEIQHLGDCKLVAGLHTIPCRVKKGEFAPGWLGYYMNSHIYHDQIIPYITGIKVSSISKSAIAGTLILIPPIEKQKEIIETLSNIDIYIKEENLLINKYHNFKSGCLTEMFPNNDSQKPKMRFPEFNDDWEQRKLGEVAKFRQGIQVDLENQYTEYTDGRERFIRIVDYTQGTDDIRYIDEIESANHVDLDDVVVVRYGATAGFVGHGITGIIANNMFTINPSNSINKGFLYTFMKQEKMYESLHSSNGSSAMPAINFGIMSNIEISFPTIDEQAQIRDYFSNLDNLIALHQRKREKYKNIKSGLISMLISLKKQ